MMRRACIPLVQMLALIAGLAVAGEPALPAVPSHWVTDKAGLLTDSTRQTLNQRLYDFERRTGHQMLVWVGDTSAELPIDEFAVRTFEAWKVGRSRLDDGLVVFVLVRDRTARIEVGYGLEERVPDAVASRILREHLLPALSSGRGDDALTSTVQALLERIEGDSAAPVLQQRFPVAQVAVVALLALAFLVLFLINPRMAINALFIITAVGRRSSSRGLSFSGGGGRSGGGGATGSW